MDTDRMAAARHSDGFLHFIVSGWNDIITSELLNIKNNDRRI